MINNLRKVIAETAEDNHVPGAIREFIDESAFSARLDLADSEDAADAFAAKTEDCIFIGNGEG